MRCYSPPSCNQSFYYDANNMTCLQCRFDCLTCNNSYQCYSCNETNRYLNNYSCLPMAGYYESNATAPLLCDGNCVTCQNTSTTCTSCIPTMILENSTCRLCGTVFASCSTCSQDSCLSCLDGYRLVNSTYCNLPCDDAKCFICNNADTSVCLQCRYDFVIG
jgi:proprotein convertase subtilisin/kexin type 5